MGLFIVVSGHAQAIRERADGAKIVVNEFGPWDFHSALKNDPDVAILVLQAMAQRFRQVLDAVL